MSDNGRPAGGGTSERVAKLRTSTERVALVNLTVTILVVAHNWEGYGALPRCLLMLGWVSACGAVTFAHRRTRQHLGSVDRGVQRRAAGTLGAALWVPQAPLMATAVLAAL